MPRRKSAPVIDDDGMTAGATDADILGLGSDAIVSTPDALPERHRRRRRGSTWTPASTIPPIDVDLVDLVVGLERLPRSALALHPRNPRTHPAEQRTLMDAILLTVGVAGAMLGYRSDTLNPGKVTLLDGHLRADAAPNHLWPVIILSCTDQQADQILIFHDRVGAGAIVDAALFTQQQQIVEVENERLAAEISMWQEELGLDRKEDELPRDVAFEAFDADIAYDYKCPSCGHIWSGAPK